jgi:plasmid stabilization system protein ParE
MRRLRFSARALEDLGRIHRWYSQPGAGQIARRRLAQIKADIRSLQKNPVMWPRREQGARELNTEGHTVVCTVTPDTGDRRTAGDVIILRVFGPGQDRSSLLEED